MYLFGRSIATTSPPGEAVHEAAVGRAALRLVPDDVEGLSDLLERALEEVVVVRREDQELGASRSRATVRGAVPGAGAATSGGSSRRRSRVGTGRGVLRPEPHPRTGRPAAGRGRSPDTGSSPQASRRARFRSARSDPAPTASSQGDRRGSRPHRGRGRHLRSRGARPRASSGVGRRARLLRPGV